MNGILGLGIWIRGFLLGRASSATEILALRQQLAVLQRQSQRPRLRDRDRLFWIVLKRFWPGWRNALHIVQPETLVRWHRAGYANVTRITVAERLSGLANFHIGIVVHEDGDSSPR